MYVVISKFLCLLITVFLLVTPSLCRGQQPTTETRRELKKAAYRLGHWQAKTMSPVGTEVLVETHFERALNDNFIVGTYRGHDTKFCFEMRFVTGWDAAAKKLKTWIFGADGAVTEMTYVGLKDEGHVWDAKIIIGGEGVVDQAARIIEAPARQTIQLLDEDGNPILSFKDWKKSSSLRFPRNSVPYAPELTSNYENLKPLHSRVGNYAGNIEFFDPKAPFKKVPLEFTNQWSLNKNFLESHFRAPVGEVFYSVHGWDPTTKSIRVWGFNGDASFGVMTETIDADGNGVATGTITTASGDLKRFRQEDSRTDDGSIRVTGSSDGRRDFEFIFRRMKAKTDSKG